MKVAFNRINNIIPIFRNNKGNTMLLESELASYEDFLKIDIRVGQIISAELNPKAIKPAYILKIDFGDLGVKMSSAQLTANYNVKDLINKRIVAVCNFKTKKVAGVNSEVLVLASVCEKAGIFLLDSLDCVALGSRIL